MDWRHFHHRSDRIREDRMDELNDWIQKLSEGRIDGGLQNDIADKILELLERKKDSLGTREKILFARAVEALSTSINSIHQPNEAGLRRCLTALVEVMIPKDVLDEPYAERNDDAKNISYAMLVATVEIIKGQIVKLEVGIRSELLSFHRNIRFGSLAVDI